MQEKDKEEKDKISEQKNINNENIATNASEEETIEKELSNSEEEDDEVQCDKVIEVFEKNDLIGGYAISVRDNWGFKILKRHITDKEKELFEKEFGEEIVKDDIFFNWWCKINKHQQNI